MPTIEHTDHAVVHRRGENRLAARPPTARTALWQGAKAMLPITAGYVPFALVLGVAAGGSADPVAGWAGSFLLFSGSAQLLLLQLVGSGAGLWAAVATAAVMNARLLVFSTTLAPLWRDVGVLPRMLAAAVVTDPVWALTTRRVQQGGSAHEHRLFFAGAASTLLVPWVATVSVGVTFAEVANQAAGAASLLRMGVPLCLAALVGAHLRTSPGVRAVLAAAVVGWLTRDWPAGTGLLVAMVAAALAGSVPRRRAVDR